MPHEPVLVQEVLDHICPRSGQTFVDFTFGFGGHTRALLEACPDVKVFCIDRDPVAYNYAQQLSDESNGRVIPIQGCMSKSLVLLIEAGCELGGVDGVVMDLGASSMQMDSTERGFGLSRDSPLDMRMSWSRDNDAPTAADVLNTLSAPQLAHIFRAYGEERFARRIANAVIECRSTLGPLRTTRQFVDLVASVVAPCPQDNQSSRHACDPDNDDGPVFPKSHAATRVFQALRIFVNDELNEVCSGLEVAHRLLRNQTAFGRGGRAAVIAFHSLEDRLVKLAFSGFAGAFSAVGLADASTSAGKVTGPYGKEKTPWRQIAGPIVPSDQEVVRNRRSRSAKLRVGEK